MRRRWTHALVSALMLVGGACASDEPGFVADTALSKQCVKQGDTQTITLTTSTGANYAYAITYPDQTAEMKPPAGTVDKSRKVVGSWQIPDRVPDGRVRVKVLVSYRKNQAQPEVLFDVARSGVCA